MLPKDDFGDAQCRNKTLSRNGRMKTEKMSRICMLCAVGTKFYQELTPVKWRGVRHYHCHKCGHLVVEGERDTGVYETYGDMAPPCLHHLVCWNPNSLQEPEPSRALSRLESFDKNIMERIIKLLRYKDVINLEMVNRQMARVIKPTKMVPIHERYLWTNEKWTGRIPEPKVRPPKIRDFEILRKLPCFVCFRIREKKHFSKRQIAMAQDRPRRYWQLRCNSCIAKLYGEGDRELLAQLQLVLHVPGLLLPCGHRQEVRELRRVGGDRLSHRRRSGHSL